MTRFTTIPVLCLSSLALLGCPPPAAPETSETPNPELRTPQASTPPATPAPAPREPAVDLSRVEIQDATLRGWVEQATRVSDYEPREPVADELALYLVHSSGAASMVLQPEADPHRGAKNGTWEAHAAGPGGVDLLRCRYQAFGKTMVLTESWNVQLLQVELAQPATKAQLEDLIQKVVRTDRNNDRPWKFELPEQIEPGLHVSSVGAPAVSAIKSRDDRADVIVTAAGVVFVFYKRVPQLATFNKADRWFRASTRAAIRG